CPTCCAPARPSTASARRGCWRRGPRPRPRTTRLLPHLRRLVPYLARHRRGLAWGLACLLATTLFSIASPWILRHAVDDLTLKITREKLQLYSGLIVALVIVEGIFRYYMRMVLIGISREIEFELRNDVFRHLTQLPARYFQTHRIGDVMSRATNDMTA